MKEKPLLALLVLWVLSVCYFTLPDAQGRDFYPIRTALEAIFQGQSPYSAEVAEHLKNNWWVASVAEVAPVVAYPLPTLLPLLPFAFVPETIMTPVWLIAMLSLLAFAAWKTRSDPLDVLCVMLFYPVLHAAWLKTSSLLWLPLVLLALFKPEKHHPLVLGVVLALLPLKPQMGLLVFPLALFTAWQKNRQAVYYGASLGAILVIASFVILPNWVPQWLEAVKQYNAQVTTIPSLLTFGVVAVLAFRILPPYAVLACATLAIFPLNDLYCCMLALVFWRAFNARVALAACVFSLLASTFPTVNSSDTIYLTILLPMLSAVAAARIEKFRRLMVRDNVASGG